MVVFTGSLRSMVRKQAAQRVVDCGGRCAESVARDTNYLILGDSDFVAAVLGKAEEKFDRKYELKRLGYDLGRVAARVCEIFGLKEQDIFSNGKQQRKVKARSLLCYWAVRELGISQTDLAKRLKLRVPGIGYSVERGETIARENGYDLVERLT